MNNEQFRRLIQDNPKSTASSSAAHDSQDGRPGRTPALGSRMRSSIPMTPRSISATTASKDFAKQLAEYKDRNRDGGDQRPAKRFKSTAAPKGTRLPGGYVDRSAERRAVRDLSDPGVQEEAGEDVENKKKRLQALEEMVKLGQMDRDTFLHLRKDLGFQGEYNDGSQQKKGLDFALLERTRRGEVDDTVQPSEDPGSADGNDQAEEDFEAALDAKVQEDVKPIEKVVQEKRGAMAPPPPLTSEDAQKMSRDEILKRLKASRKAAAAVTTQDEGSEAALPDSSLGTKFKKIGGAEKKRWTEIDEKTGRRKEILMTTDKDGNPKRKVRWLDKEPIAKATEPINSTTGSGGKKKPAAPAVTVLGMEVPAEVLARQKAQQAEDQNDEDDDIFAGVGTNYDPLANVAEEDSSDSSESDTDSSPKKEEEDGEIKTHKDNPKNKVPEPTPSSSIPTSSSTVSFKPRNYFSTSTTTTSTTADPHSSSTSSQSPLSTDPNILAALKRAAALRQAQEASSSTLQKGKGSEFDNSDDVLGNEADATEKRNASLLAKIRQRDAADAADLDMGFGESRFGDDDDDDDEDDGMKKVKLTEWRGTAAAADDADGGGGAGGGGGNNISNKRKRGPKKRKGNKDSVEDVMRVLEGRKQEVKEKQK